MMKPKNIFLTSLKKFDTSTVGIPTLLMAFRRTAQTFPPHTSSKYLTSKHWL